MKKTLLLMATVSFLHVQPSHAANAELFTKLDTNKDNKVSSQEFSKIEAKRAHLITRIFERFDTNKDNYLDQAEWKVAQEQLEKMAKNRK